MPNIAFVNSLSLSRTYINQMSDLTLIQILGLIIVCPLLFCADRAFAEPKQAKPVLRLLASRPKSDVGSRSSASQIGLTESLGGAVKYSLDSRLYDQVSIMSLRRLSEDPSLRGPARDIDTVRMKRVTERALALQTGRTVNHLLKDSDLKPAIEEFKRTLAAVQDRFRYSVQYSGESLEVSRKTEGTRLIELNLDFNLSRGIDPQLRVGDSMRLRYDFVNKRSMLEYGIEF